MDFTYFLIHGFYYDLTNVTKLKIQFNTIIWTLCGLFFLPRISHSLVHMPLMCIIQNMLRYYIKRITNVDPLKPKVIKLTYTRKVTFNISGTIIHFALAIPLNETLT